MKGVPKALKTELTLESQPTEDVLENVAGTQSSLLFAETKTPPFLKVYKVQSLIIFPMSRIQSKITWHMMNQENLNSYGENQQPSPMARWHRCSDYLTKTLKQLL